MAILSIGDVIQHPHAPRGSERQRISARTPMILASIRGDSTIHAAYGYTSEGRIGMLFDLALCGLFLHGSYVEDLGAGGVEDALIRGDLPAQVQCQGCRAALAEAIPLGGLDPAES